MDQSTKLVLIAMAVAAFVAYRKAKLANVAAVAIEQLDGKKNFHFIAVPEPRPINTKR